MTKTSAPVRTLNPLLIIIILLLMTLTQMSTDQYIPSLPAIALAFQSSEASIQLTLSLFMLGLGISHPLYGPLSDKIGRKVPLLLGVGISICGSLLCFYAPTLAVLLLGRFLQGFGIGCCNSVGRSLVRDLYTDRMLAKIGSYVGIVCVFIMTTSPILGGYIQIHSGWRTNFLVIFLFGLFVWLLLLFSLPETNKQLNPRAMEFKAMGANYISLLRSNVFIGYTLCACFAFSGLVSYFTIGPFLFQNTLSLSPLQFGQLSFFIAGAICVSGMINSVLVMRKGIQFMVGIGVLLMALGGLSLVIITLLDYIQVFSIMSCVAVFSVGAGFTFINAFAGAFHPFPHIAGTAGALYASMQDITGASTSVLIALNKDYGQLTLGIILLLLGIGALITWCYLTYKTSLIDNH